MRKNIRTFNLLVVGNKCEIYLFTKEKKKKKKNEIQHIKRLEIFHIIECFLREKKGEILHDVLNLFVSVYKKNTSCGKIKLTIK